MYTYLIINILIVIFPLILSFDKNLGFIKCLKYYLISIIPVNIFMIFWDVVATYLQHWSFNKNKITGFHIGNLPVEEILFFFTSSYSVLFIYEVVNYYIKDSKIKSRYFTEYLFFLGLFIFFCSFLFIPSYYTFISLFILSCVIISSVLYFKENIISRNFWITLLIIIIPFIIINTLLTIIPVVIYSNTEILNIRFITIPIEDFIFNTIMVILYIISYIYFKNRFSIKYYVSIK